MIATPVLIVGAGPAGLLTAAELARRGVECLLIDAHEQPMDWDRATVVHPRSLEILDALGIAEPLLQAGVKQRHAHIHANGAVLGDIDLSLCGSRYPFNIGISEEVTESILHDHLVALGGAVTRATTLVDLQVQSDGVIATVEHHGERSQVHAQWVVGCDGHRSTVRTLMGIEQDGHDIHQPWAVFDASIAAWPMSYEANYAYLDPTPVILTALPGRRWRVYLRPASADSDLVADALVTLQRYLPDARFDDVSHPTRFDCHAKVAQQFRSGRVLLAGDAAHTCSPAQGHGMNTGLQDAYNLGWKLALVCQGHCAETLLDSYHAERRPVADQVMASGDAAESAQSVTGQRARHERDMAIQAAFADPDTRHHEAVAEAELDIDYAGSPIVMGEPQAALWPGQRLPDQITLAFADGSTGRLHACAYRVGHTAVLIGCAYTNADELARVRREMEALSGGPIIEQVVALSANAGVAGADAYLTADVADTLGVRGIVLLVIRADGHVGLRAGQDHAGALAAYIDRLRT
jgi:2-polyprenyl-6-methoxyphenol hydroxylase-like FAD-dependent oxidoreductase